MALKLHDDGAPPVAAIEAEADGDVDGEAPPEVEMEDVVVELDEEPHAASIETAATETISLSFT